jgi:hypothetical protein
MKTALIALMACAAMAPAASAAEMIHGDGMTGPEVVAWLQKAGYKAALSKDSGGDPMIDSASGGANFKIYFYDCKDARCKALQFSAGFNLKEPLTLEKANAWNSKHRYLKTYLDEEGDPYVQYDVNLNAGRTIEGLNDDFEIWVDMLPDFTTFIDW